MRRIKRLNILIMLAVFWSIIQSFTPVFAATTATASWSGPANAEVGDDVTITLVITESGSGVEEGIAGVQGPLTIDEKLQYVSNKSLNLGVNYNNSSKKLIGMVSDSSEYLTGTNNIISFTFKAKSEGTAVVSIDLAVSDAGGNKILSKVISKTITINEATPSPSPSMDPSPSTSPNPPAKSGDATLKTLNVSGYTLSPTFKKNTNTYSMKVKNNITGLDVTAIPTSSKAVVEISGNKNWKEGVNVVSIKVTAEDGTVNIYTVNVTRESANKTTTTTKSSDNYLKSLVINSPHEISPKFNKSITSYDITVPYEVDKLDLSYVTNHSKAKVTIIGNNDFKVGAVNTVELEVKAEDGTLRIYTLNVTRSTASSNTDLEKLEIKEGILNPNFSPDILEYKVKVDNNVDKLNITAIAKDKDAKVEIIGNENLKEGKNTVLVKVTDKDGFTKYYTIEVEKEVKSNTILGLTPLQFWTITGIIGLLLFLLLLLLLLLFKKKNQEQEEKEEKVVTPIIEVKPEFNFGSKNSSDDDVVHGNFNQNSEIENDYKDDDKYIVYEDSLPNDPYDNTVTKREIVDAIHEATRTKDSSKLKMLLEQDALNQKKKELKKKEEELRRYEKKVKDDWR